MQKAETYRIYLDGRHYDRMLPGRDEVRRFLMARARKARGPVLEMACGTGAYALPLALEGVDITGLDLSPEMLAVAREKSRAAGAATEWVEGDMRDFHLGRRFQLVYLVGNAICHLLDRASLEGCLACVREHLSPGGRFVVSVFVPNQALLLRESRERETFAEYDDPDVRGRVVVSYDYRYEPDTQIKRHSTYHRFPGVADEVEGTLDMRMYYPQELDALLEYNGLEILEKAGGFAGEVFDGDAGMQVITLRVRNERA